MPGKTLAAALALSALWLTPLPGTLAPTLDQAYAGNGNGNGNGNGGQHGGGGHDRSGAGSRGASGQTRTKPASNGAIASELKGLNAYHASAQAFANAAPNSQVGRLAAYRNSAIAAQDAEAETLAAAETLAEAQAALAAAQASGTATPEELGALQSAVDAATASLATATTDSTSAQEAEDATLDQATGGRTLTRGTLEYLRDKLGIPDGSQTLG